MTAARRFLLFELAAGAARYRLDCWRGKHGPNACHRHRFTMRKKFAVRARKLPLRQPPLVPVDFR